MRESFRMSTYCPDCGKSSKPTTNTLKKTLAHNSGCRSIREHNFLFRAGLQWNRPVVKDVKYT